MDELRTYLSAVMRHWIALFGGPSVAALILVLQSMAEKEVVPTWMLWSLAGVCIPLAMFFAWQDEHRRAEELSHGPRLEISEHVKEIKNGLETVLYIEAYQSPCQKYTAHNVKAWIVRGLYDGRDMSGMELCSKPQSNPSVDPGETIFFQVMKYEHLAGHPCVSFPSKNDNNPVCFAMEGPEKKNQLVLRVTARDMVAREVIFEWDYDGSSCIARVTSFSSV